MSDDVTYRCIHAACARTLPRPVDFCPYCGTGQHAGLVKPGAQAPARAEPFVMPAPAAAQPAAPAPAPAAAATPAPVPARVTPAAPVVRAPVRPAGVPPGPRPIRTRYWVLAVVCLCLIWLVTRPDGARRIDKRIDDAIALTANCDFDQARAELVALKSAKATADQIKRLQKAVNDALPACEKKQQRAKAWSDTLAFADSALQGKDADKAQTRLNAFVRRWGDDKDTRELAARITAARASADRPASVTGASDRVAPVQTGQQAGKFITDAEREIAAGNYQAAIDKLDVCIMMIEDGKQACTVARKKADRLNKEMLRCVASGKEWIDDRCQ